MLDHDELLPEEQANPRLVRQLRATYQMSPEEQRVLSRVYERLAQTSLLLPVSEPIRAERNTHEPRQSRLFSPVFASSYHARPAQLWSSRFSTFAAVLFVALLVGSLALTFTVIKHDASTAPLGAANSIRVVLVPAEKGRTPSQAEMETTSNILSQRFSNFGLDGASVSLQSTQAQPGILVIVPHFGGNEQQTLNMLLAPGSLGIWATGPASLPLGTTLDPSQYSQENPGGKPQFTGADLNPDSLAVRQDPTSSQFEIGCVMQGDAVARFQTFTANNIGETLTFTLDGKVLTSPTIQSPISGQFVIIGNFSEQQAKALVVVLKSGPLPVALQRQR